MCYRITIHQSRHITVEKADKKEFGEEIVWVRSLAELRKELADIGLSEREIEEQISSLKKRPDLKTALTSRLKKAHRLAESIAQRRCSPAKTPLIAGRIVREIDGVMETLRMPLNGKINETHPAP